MSEQVQADPVNPAILARRRVDGGKEVLSIEVSTSRPEVELTSAEWRSVLAVLQDLGGAPSQTDGLREELQALVRAAKGTSAACGYHLATRDHPFLDMSKGQTSRRVDNEMMTVFVAEGEYPSVYLDLAYDVSWPLEQARDLEMPQLWSNPKYQLDLIVSGSFGKRRHIAAYRDPYWEYEQVELLNKPIPSGGSRHPTEAFFSVESSTIVPLGTYHFNVRHNALTRIAAEPLADLLPDMPRDQTASETYVVLLGSMVERAMFRYRDPRSLRALLVDAGHADAQLAALAAYCNWAYRSRVMIDMEDVPNRLGQSGEVMPILLGGVLQAWV